MVRLKENNFIAIFNEKMIEVEVSGKEGKEEAYKKAKDYFEAKEKRKLLDDELIVCQIPSIIGVLG